MDMSSIKVVHNYVAPEVCKVHLRLHNQPLYDFINMTVYTTLLEGSFVVYRSTPIPQDIDIMFFCNAKVIRMSQGTTVSKWG